MREQIFDNTEKKMMSEKKEVLTKEEAKKFIEGNDFIGRSKWSFWIPIIFLLVPEDKFIARKFIDEIIGEWGYGRNRKASEAGKFVHDHSVMTNLNGLLKKGLLERRQLNERGGFSGEDAAKQRKLWCKENVYGPVNPIFGPRTQSVFILTEKGRERALDILEEFALPENDSSKNILDFLDSENAEYFESKRDRLGLKEKEFLNIIFKVARTNDP